MNINDFEANKNDLLSAYYEKNKELLSQIVTKVQKELKKPKNKIDPIEAGMNYLFNQGKTKIKEIDVYFFDPTPGPRSLNGLPFKEKNSLLESIIESKMNFLIKDENDLIQTNRLEVPVKIGCLSNQEFLIVTKSDKELDLSTFDEEFTEYLKNELTKWKNDVEQYITNEGFQLRNKEFIKKKKVELNHKPIINDSRINNMYLIHFDDTIGPDGINTNNREIESLLDIIEEGQDIVAKKDDKYLHVSYLQAKDKAFRGDYAQYAIVIESNSKDFPIKKIDHIKSKLQEKLETYHKNLQPIMKESFYEFLDETKDAEMTFTKDDFLERITNKSKLKLEQLMFRDDYQ